MDLAYLEQFLNQAKNLPITELKQLEQVFSTLVLKKQGKSLATGEPVAFNAPFTLPKLNVPAEMFVKYHQYVFEAFLTEMFNPYDDSFYHPSDPDVLTNNSDVIVSSSWNNTDQKLGQLPRIVVDTPFVALSELYMADVPGDPTKNISSSIRNENRECMMTINMTISAIAGTEAEATNLANLILVNLAKTRKIIRELLNLYQITYPSMTSGAPMEDEPVNRFMATLQFQTKHQVKWHEQITEKVFKGIIYRLAAVCSPTDNKPLINMILGSNTLRADPALKKYIETAMEAYEKTPYVNPFNKV